MGRYFDENYELLRTRLEVMAGRVASSVSDAVDALSRADLGLAERVVAEDEKIDFLEVEIDELALKLFALQQPMAIDLRLLVTALKVNNDLERMGDQAVNIAQGLLVLRSAPEPGYMADFARMTSIVHAMARDAIHAFLNGDVALAKDVVRRDDEVDAMNRSLIKRLVEQAKNDPSAADACISLVLITRNIERIGDLSTNIAEDVVYYIEGKFVKHSPEFWASVHPENQPGARG